MQAAVLLAIFVNFKCAWAIRSKDAMSEQEDSLENVELDCDVDAEDQKVYGPKVQSGLCPKGIGCTYWDACRRLEDKSCPAFCRPWKEEVTASRAIRAYQWFKRKATGTCPRNLASLLKYEFCEPFILF